MRGQEKQSRDRWAFDQLRLPDSDLNRNARELDLLARKVPSVGVYASVLRGGTIRLGDTVRLAGPAPLQRAAAFLHAIKRALRRR